MFTTMNSNENRVASLTVMPHGRVWRMVEVELAMPLFFPTWYVTEDSATICRRAMLSDWDDVLALLSFIGPEALSHLQCIYPQIDGDSELWRICTIKKAFRAIQTDISRSEVMVFEGEDGTQIHYPFWSRGPLDIREQVWSA